MDTRLQLLATAEKLFAQRGFEAVSMREINRVSGQGNASALHYHFGTRDALIEAIVAWRMQPVNERRHALFNEKASAGREVTPHDLAEVLVHPLSEVAASPVVQNGWLLFLGQIYASGTIDLAAMTSRIGSDSSLRLLEKHARTVLPKIPTAIVDQRVSILIRQAVHALAEWQRRSLPSSHNRQPRQFRFFVANLVDMTTAALAALPSEQALRALAPRGRVVSGSRIKDPSRIATALTSIRRSDIKMRETGK